ncbi:MAG: hypothetical protein L7S48_01480 [Candidatus Poseidonia sp.]|nr:hypothetical protein [Poseidonia sp.]
MEDEIAPAPQSIVIQAGTPAPTEIAAAPTEQVEAQTEGPTPSATSASGVSKEAVETYITVMNVKDNSNGTAVLAAIFLFFIPLLFGISFFENFDDGGCFLCLGSIGLGTVFAIISVTESTINQHNQKNAKLRIIEEAGLHSPPASKVPLYIGVTSLAVLFLLNFVLPPVFYSYEYALIYDLVYISSILGLLVSGVLSLERDHKRKKTINQLVNVIVDKETKKPGT